MPTYDFKCTKCGSVQECIVPSFESIPTKFCKCDGDVTIEKLEHFTKSKPVFKGTGFYETDYKKG